MSTMPTVTPEWIVERVRKHLPLYTFRCFHLRVDNSKRRGRKPVEYIETYGVVFPCGRVAVATDGLPRKGYESMDDLMESLSQYGKVEVEEVGEVSV